MITTASGSPPQTHYLKHMRSVKRQRDKKKLQKKDARCVASECPRNEKCEEIRKMVLILMYPAG